MLFYYWGESLREGGAQNARPPPQLEQMSRGGICTPDSHFSLYGVSGAPPGPTGANEEGEDIHLGPPSSPPGDDEVMMRWWCKYDVTSTSAFSLVTLFSSFAILLSVCSMRLFAAAFATHNLLTCFFRRMFSWTVSAST